MDFDINTQWTKNHDAIFKYAIQQNDQGNPFPIFGTCMGIQLQAYLTSNYNEAIITRVNGDEAIIHPLNFVNDGYIFHTLNSDQMSKLSKGSGIMYFNHNWAITMDTFNNNQYLKSFWNLVATATTPRNEKFVAAWEAKKYPFYGVQFHPEKSPFEWKVFADRSIEAF